MKSNNKMLRQNPPDPKEISGRLVICSYRIPITLTNAEKDAATMLPKLFHQIMPFSDELGRIIYCVQAVSTLYMPEL
jgi:hypothetical protein